MTVSIVHGPNGPSTPGDDTPGTQGTQGTPSKGVQTFPSPWEQARERRRLPGEITLMEAAERLGYSYTWVYKLIVNDGTISHRRDGGFIFVRAASVEILAMRPKPKLGPPRKERK